MSPQPDVPGGGLVCESRAMRRFVTELANVASSDAPVLIWGEPSVGKERAARVLHQRSAHEVSDPAGSHMQLFLNLLRDRMIQLICSMIL